MTKFEIEQNLNKNDGTHDKERRLFISFLVYLVVCLVLFLFVHDRFSNFVGLLVFFVCWRVGSTKDDDFAISSAVCYLSRFSNVTWLRDMGHE